MKDIVYITESEAKSVYWRIVEKFMASGDPIRLAGLMSLDKLQAAVERPKTGFGSHEHFPCVYTKAACYAHSIITTHPYRDGNKRAAMETAFAFLAKNRVMVEVSSEQYVQAALYVAEHKWDLQQLATWLMRYSRPYTDWFDAHLQQVDKDGKFQQKRYPWR